MKVNNTVLHRSIRKTLIKIYVLQQGTNNKQVKTRLVTTEILVTAIGEVMKEKTDDLAACHLRLLLPRYK